LLNASLPIKRTDLQSSMTTMSHGIQRKFLYPVSQGFFFCMPTSECFLSLTFPDQNCAFMSLLHACCMYYQSYCVYSVVVQLLLSHN
jgi:hypothetical protein